MLSNTTQRDANRTVELGASDVALCNQAQRAIHSDRRRHPASDRPVKHSPTEQGERLQHWHSASRLPAGVAHELNTPMQYVGDNVRFVAGCLERLSPLIDCLPMLLDPGVSDDQLLQKRAALIETMDFEESKKWLQQIPAALDDSIDGVAVARKIVMAIKEFSHPGSEHQKAVSVNHIVNSALTISKCRWRYVADVTTDFQPDLPSVVGHPTELGQAILNLLLNSVDAIEDRVACGDYQNGAIHITTISSDTCVTINITDNGGGIPASVRDRIFDPFSTTKGIGRGTGQGLAITHDVIVGMHGGHVRFEVQEDEGTTFTVDLPTTN